jgi:hypothetical protein
MIAYPMVYEQRWPREKENQTKLKVVNAEKGQHGEEIPWRSCNS